MADLAPHLAGLLAGLGGQLGDLLRKTLFQGLERGLDELGRRLGQLVDLAHALGDALTETVVAGQALLEVGARHLQTLVAEDAEAHGDVGGVPSQVGDALREGGEVVRDFGHGCLLGRGTLRTGRNGRGRVSAFGY